MIPETNVTAVGTPRGNIFGMKFKKTASSTRVDSQEPADATETRPEKRSRVETDPNSADEVEADVTPTNGVDSLSNYSVSRPNTPPVDTKPTQRPDTTALSEEDKKVANDFLARLKANANAHAREQTPNIPVPDVPPVVAKYTPKPAGGFPVVYGRNSTHAFDNIDIQQITDWMNLPGTRIFVQPLSHGFYPPAVAQEIVGTLQAAICDIFGCENVKITAPMASSPPSGTDRPPYTYLVRNISPDVAAALIDQQCWATNKIGFLVYTAEAIRPKYLGAVEGFNITDDEDITQIHELIAQTLYQSPVSTIIAEISAHEPSLASLDRTTRVEQIIQSLGINAIKIRAQGGSLRPIINIYIDCPFESDEDWSRLVTAVASTEFRHSLLGTGTAHRGWTCTICHGADHPSGLCPFPLTPGWIAATPIAPIVEYRNRSSRQIRDTTETRRGRGGSNRFSRGGPTRGRGNSNRSRGT
jgi:hypothetical protein